MWKLVKKTKFNHKSILATLFILLFVFSNILPFSHDFAIPKAQASHATRLWIFGAESGSASEVAVNTGAPAISGATVRSGTYSLLTNGSDVSFLALPNYPAQSTMYSRSYLNFAALPSIANVVIQMAAGAAGVSTLMMNTDGTLTAKIGASGGTAVGTSTTALLPNTWYRIDLKTVVSATAGIIEVRINGTVEITASSLNTGTSNITGVAYGPRLTAQNIFWDDIIEDSGGYATDGRVIARQPIVGVPTYDAWTKTGFDPYWADTPPNTASRATSVAGTAQTKLIGSFSSTQTGHGPEAISSSDTINSMKVLYYQGKTTGPAGTYNMRQRVGGIDTDTGVTLTTTYQFYEGPYTTPTLANLNVMEAGGQSSDARYVIADLWVMVDYKENSPPTVALNTADLTDFGTDTTPTLEFTGTDTELNDIRYNVQISDNADFSSWYNSNWSYRVKITVDNTKVNADLTNFPVYVNLANLPAGFHTNVNQTDARDIRVISSDGITELPREVVSYDSATDTGELHFKADSLADTTNTNFYIYYGNAGAAEPAPTDTYGRNNVWDSNFKTVQHLKDDTTSTVKDSTVNANDGTKLAANEPIQGTGKIGKGQTFDGSNDNINHGNGASFSITSAITVEAWINTNSLGTRQVFSAKTGTADDSWLVEINPLDCPSGTPYFFLRGPADSDLCSTSAVTTGSWYHVAFTYSGSQKIIYINGSAAGEESTTGSIDINTQPVRIGNWGDGNRPFNGTIDEVRISNSVRNSGWIATEYNNQNSPATFYSVGTQVSSAVLLLLNKISGTDAGFVNTVTGGDLDPFNSGEMVSYTVQVGEALSTGTYYWRVRGKDPVGSNTYGAFSGARSFTVNVGGAPDATSVTYTVSPDGGRSGDSITITGTNFGTVSAGSRANCAGGAGTGCVRFTVGGNATVADGDVTAWSATSISFTINASLASDGGTAALEVVAASQADTTKLTFFIYPKISSLTVPTAVADAAREFDSGDSDGVITANGDHFGTAGTVTIIGSTATQQTTGTCTVTAYQATCVGLQVPASIADTTYTGSIVLTRTSDSKTHTFSGFRVLPRIISNTPTSGVIGDVIQIDGNHFCESGTCPVSPPTAGDIVEFGITAAISTDFVTTPNCTGASKWGHAQICVKVPAGTPTGSQPTKVTSNTSYTSNTKAFTLSAAATTTLATGTDPGAATIAPGAGATDVDIFTLQTDTGTESISSVTVSLSTANGIGTLAITDNANAVLGSTTSPVTGSNAVTVSGMSAGTTLITFKVRVTPLSHSAMPVPPGGSYAVTAPVTAWAGSNTHAGSDTNPNALTIDNASPSSATGVGGSAGAGGNNTLDIIFNRINGTVASSTSVTIQSADSSKIINVTSIGNIY